MQPLILFHNFLNVTAMLDIAKENDKLFNAVLQSVEDLHKTETAIENEKNLIAQFTDFLSKNTGEIEKFHSIENELIDYLKKYSFTGNLDFTPVKNILQPLTALKQKLAEMGKEAKALAGLPDRYNCHKAMDACKNLTLFCVNEMKSADYDKVTTALDANIPKLQAIKKEFDTEEKILGAIKNVMNKNQTVLNTYTAFKIELEQFVSNFPNDRDNDLATVEHRLQKLNEIDKTANQINSIAVQIQNFADRYGKNNILQKALQFLSLMNTKMKFNDADKVKNELDAIHSQLKNVTDNFDKESNASLQLLIKLQQRTPDCWEEENENLISDLSAIINQDSRKVNFVLQDYYDSENNAINKKKQDIINFERQHADLLSRYGQRLSAEIKNKYVSYSFFEQWIADIIKEERQRKNASLWKIAKIVGIILGIGIAIGLIIWAFSVHPWISGIIALILIIIAIKILKD